MNNDACCTSSFLTTPLNDCAMLDDMDADIQTEVLARAYVPWQMPGGRMYSMCEGLERGTIYPALDQPYTCPYSCAVGSEEEINPATGKGGCC